MNPPQIAQPNLPNLRPRSRFVAGIRALIRARLTAGLITILPIVITLWLVQFVFGLLRDASLWVMKKVLLIPWAAEYAASWGVDVAALREKGLDALSSSLQWGISIFCVLLAVFLLYVIGLFTANILGSRLLAIMDHLVDRVPLIKTVYRSSKQVLTTFSGEQRQSFQSVALIPFPHEGMRSVGFVTGRFSDSLSGEPLVAVFMPCTPPWTGFVLILKRADVVEVDWSVEDAITVIMSGGILHPTSITLAPREPIHDGVLQPVST